MTGRRGDRGDAANARTSRLGTTVVVITVALWALVSGCSSGDGGTGAEEAATTVATPSAIPSDRSAAVPTRSAGCGLPIEPGSERFTLATDDGRRREYLRYVPQGYDPDVAVPVVLDFHGLGSDATQQGLISAMDELAEREVFVAVHPQGTVLDLIGMAFWNATGEGFAAPTLAVDDVAFVDQLLDQLATDLCVDPARVHATGFSNGGFLSARLACDLADRIASVATVAGIAHDAGCEPSRPVPILHIHGTDDAIVPYFGGQSTLSAPGRALDLDGFAPLGFEPIEDEVQGWADEYGCWPAPDTESVADDVERRIWRGCEDGAVVEFYIVDGGGHTWPGSVATALLERFVGSTTASVDATELIWAFFTAHPRHDGG